jgi:predicted transcriptional regulator
MPMGVVSFDDFESEVGKTVKSDKVTTPTPARIESTIQKGRKEGDVEVPESIRKLIGQTSVEEGRQSAIELARQLGISESSVSAYSHGATSTSSYHDTPNISNILKSKEKISKRARNKLMMALNHITDEKLAEAKVRDLAGVAKDMSTVVKQMDERENKDNVGKDGPTFVFYSPQTKKEDVFDVIVSKE